MSCYLLLYNLFLYVNLFLITHCDEFTIEDIVTIGNKKIIQIEKEYLNVLDTPLIFIKCPGLNFTQSEYKLFNLNIYDENTFEYTENNSSTWNLVKKNENQLTNKTIFSIFCGSVISKDMKNYTYERNIKLPKINIKSKVFYNIKEEKVFPICDYNNKSDEYIYVTEIDNNAFIIKESQLSGEKLHQKKLYVFKKNINDDILLPCKIFTLIYNFPSISFVPVLNNITKLETEINGEQVSVFSFKNNDTIKVECKVKSDEADNSELGIIKMEYNLSRHEFYEDKDNEISENIFLAEEGYYRCFYKSYGVKTYYENIFVFKNESTRNEFSKDVVPSCDLNIKTFYNLKSIEYDDTYCTIKNVTMCDFNVNDGKLINKENIKKDTNLICIYSLLNINNYTFFYTKYYKKQLPINDTTTQKMTTQKKKNRTNTKKSAIPLETSTESEGTRIEESSTDNPYESNTTTYVIVSLITLFLIITGIGAIYVYIRKQKMEELERKERKRRRKDYDSKSTSDDDDDEDEAEDDA